MSNNVLIAYFSWSGNTKIVAEKIKSYTNGDIFQIETFEKYPDDYNEVLNVSRDERIDNKRPEIKSFNEDIDKYEFVFIGYPNWWGDMPMAVYSFLEKYNFSGKNIIPFCTHGGSGFSGTEHKLKKMLPKCHIIKGLEIGSRKVNSCDNDLKKWIEKLDI
jgi:flavodoxin